MLIMEAVKALVTVTTANATGTGVGSNGDRNVHTSRRDTFFPP